MNIRALKNKTKTYLAGDWSGDKAAIDKLHDGMREIVGVFISLMYTT